MRQPSKHQHLQQGCSIEFSLSLDTSRLSRQYQRSLFHYIGQSFLYVCYILHDKAPSDEILDFFADIFSDRSVPCHPLPFLKLVRMVRSKSSPLFLPLPIDTPIDKRVMEEARWGAASQAVHG